MDVTLLFFEIWTLIKNIFLRPTMLYLIPGRWLGSLVLVLPGKMARKLAAYITQSLVEKKGKTNKQTKQTNFKTRIKHWYADFIYKSFNISYSFNMPAKVNLSVPWTVLSLGEYIFFVSCIANDHRQYSSYSDVQLLFQWRSKYGIFFSNNESRNPAFLIHIRSCL